MNHPENFPAPFCLHQWLIQPDLNRISGPAGPVQIEPRVMAVLLVLAENPGELVTRLDLLDRVWGDAVVGEEILTRAISELRRVFADSARKPAYIETIRNNGYRLIAPVTAVVPEPIPDPTPDIPRAAQSLPPEPASARQGGSWLRRLFFAAALVALGVFGPRLLDRDDGSLATDASAPVAIPLTTFSGREYHPALAADGMRVAFAWSGPNGGRTAIYIKQRNSETPLQLSDEPGWAAWPTWSPDGQTVAFVQTAAANSDICLVPSLGGAVRRVQKVAHLIEGLDWSADGTTLAYSARDTASGGHRLYLLDLGTLQATLVPLNRQDNAGDFQPRFSPDGEQMAWIGHDRTGGQGVFVAPVTGGQTRAVVRGLDNLQGLAWTADGRQMVFAAAPAGIYDLWQVPVSGGEPDRIVTPGDFAWNPTVARNTGDLVYEQVRVDQDLWRVSVSDDEDQPTISEPFITSTRWEFEAEYHPDGASVAFVSARGGSPEVWLGDAKGENLRKITTLHATSVNNLRWAPGGDWLAFNAVVDGEHRILVTDPAGGTPRQLTTGHPREVFTAWSASGDDLLIGADDGEGWEVYRLGVAGGTPHQITRGGGLTAQEAADGRTLYFTRPNRPGLWRRQSGGRVEPELVLPDLQIRDRFNWRLFDDRIIWIMRAGEQAVLLTHDVNLGRSYLLAELPGFQGSGLAVAPAGDAFLYPKLGDAAGDLMFIAGREAKK